MGVEFKTKEFDISNDGRPKMVWIGDYWYDNKTTNIVNLLKEYQDNFVCDYKDLKELVEEMGKMKIEFIPRAKPIKKWPYKLAHKYKLMIQKEIEWMLQAWIIYPINKVEWESPMVVQPKEHDPKKLRICVDFWRLNKQTMTDPFLTPFADEIKNDVIGHKCYSFTDGFSRYNQVPIAKADQEKTTFVLEFGSFSYRVMPFGLKNAPIGFSRIVVKVFQDYIYKTMVVYLDNWKIYILFKNHI